MRISRLLVGAVAALALGVQANADIIEQEQTFNVGGSSSIPDPGVPGAAAGPVSGTSQTLLFNRFDPSAGTLNSITWMVSGNAAAFGDALLTRIGGDSSPATGNFSANFFVDLGLQPNGMQSFGLDITRTGTCTADINAPAGRCDGLDVSETLSIVPTILSPADFSGFLGLGQFGMNANSSTQFFVDSIAGPAVGTGFSSIEGQYTLKLTYDFTPGQPVIPEPSTVILLGTALLGLGVVRRRRK